MSKYILLFLLIFPMMVFGWTGKVYKITDGDTFKVNSEETTLEIIRLYGIDCPEQDQKFGDEATEYLSELIMNQTVEIEQMDIDLYGRVVAIVTLNETNINESMIKSGYAWVYNRYCKEDICDNWKDIQNDVSNEGIGLWKAKNTTPPWDYRRGIDKPYKGYLSWLIIIGLTLLFWFLLRWKNIRRKKRRR